MVQKRVKACQAVLYYSYVYLMVYIWIQINSAARRRRFVQHRLYLHQWSGRVTQHTRTCRYMSVSTIKTQGRMVSTSAANFGVSSLLIRLICLTLLTNAYNIRLSCRNMSNLCLSALFSVTVDRRSAPRSYVTTARS